MTAKLKPATVVQYIEDWLVFILHDSQAETSKYIEDWLVFILHDSQAEGCNSCSVYRRLAGVYTT